MTSYERWKYCDYVSPGRKKKCGAVASYESEGGRFRFVCERHKKLLEQKYRKAALKAEQDEIKAAEEENRSGDGI